MEFIETNFSDVEHLIHLAKVMKVWEMIQEFLHKVIVNEAQYMEEVTKSRSDTKTCYEYGADTFLTRLLKAIKILFIFILCGIIHLVLQREHSINIS